MSRLMIQFGRAAGRELGLRRPDIIYVREPTDCETRRDVPRK